MGHAAERDKDNGGTKGVAGPSTAPLAMGLREASLRMTGLVERAVGLGSGDDGELG